LKAANPAAISRDKASSTSHRLDFNHTEPNTREDMPSSTDLTAVKNVFRGMKTAVPFYSQNTNQNKEGRSLTSQQPVAAVQAPPAIQLPSPDQPPVLQDQSPQVKRDSDTRVPDEPRKKCSTEQTKDNPTCHTADPVRPVLYRSLTKPSHSTQPACAAEDCIATTGHASRPEPHSQGLNMQRPMSRRSRTTSRCTVH